MKITAYPLGQLQANCYFLVEDKECLLIDPADSADFLLEEIQRRNLELVGMIATHGHFDHVMAVGEIQLSFPDLPLYINFEDKFLVERLNKTAQYFLGFDPHTIEPRKYDNISEKELTIGNFSFTVINTPGHTPGSVCLYQKEEDIIFTGDTLFQGAIGRYDFKYSDKDLLDESLQKLYKLPVETIVYPGHGELTSIGAEVLNKDLFIDQF